jgi:cellulose synthase (UDP-forming)
MTLTILGLVVNASSEWRIIGQAGLLPIVACWAAINIVVLFLICMMSLQAPVRRGEERFKLDEPIWIFAVNGALSMGRIKDISLTGAGIVADGNLAFATQCGEAARVFIAGVGFVAATVVRQDGRFLAVHFILPPSVERELLIRKLFTAGLDATTVTASALSSTGAMLMSIWSTNEKRLEVEVEAAAIPVLAADKLPAQSLVVLSQQQPKRLAKLAAERSIAA